jgi:WD40 repeat protein
MSARKSGLVRLICTDITGNLKFIAGNLKFFCCLNSSCSGMGQFRRNRHSLPFLGMVCLYVSLLENVPFASAAEQATKVEISVPLPHSGSISVVAFSHEGRTIATGSTGDTVKLWDALTGRFIRSVEGKPTGISAIAFSSDDRRIVAGGRDGSLKVWETESGSLSQSFIAHSNQIDAVAFSPDGSLLASGGFGAFKVWSTETWKQPFHAHTGGEFNVKSVAFTPDGHTVVSADVDYKFGGTTGTTRRWNAATGEILQTFKVSGKGVTAVSGDARWVAWVDQWSDHPAVDIQDAESNKVISFPVRAGAKMIAWSPDNSLVALGAAIWRVDTGELVRSLDGPVGEQLALSPDKKRVVSGGEHGWPDLWDVRTGHRIKLNNSFGGAANAVNALAVSPNGHWIVSASGGRSSVPLLKAEESVVQLWNAETGKLVRHLEGPQGYVASLAISSDSQSLLTGGSKLTLREIETGKRVRDIPDLKPDHEITTVSFSSDGKRVVSGSVPNNYCRKDCSMVHIWDPFAPKLLASFGEKFTDAVQFSIRSAKFSPDGVIVAANDLKASSVNGSIVLWSEKGKRLRTISATNWVINEIDISPDGSVIAGGDEGLKWFSASGNASKTLGQQPLEVRSIAASQNGKWVASGRQDGTIELLDAASGKPVHTFQAHLGEVNALVFSPDGTRIASGGADTAVKIWDVVTGLPLVSLVGTQQGEWLAIVREGLAVTPPRAGGFFNASSVENNMLAVVRGLEVTGIDQIYQSLFSPDLVREALAGDRDREVEKAAQELNLEKVLDSGRPPLVEITTPALGSQVDTDLLTAQGTISNEGGGIGRIEWRVNGLTVGVENAPQATSKMLLVSRALPLDPVENAIELVAYNGRNLLASVAAKTSVTSTAAKTDVKPKLHAIVFGLNNYEGTGLRSLHYAVPDAIELGRALKAAGKGLYQEVKVKYVLDPPASEKGLGRVFEPTSDGLEKAFEAVGKEVDVHDTFVFFAAGHGKAVNGRFHLIAKDFYFEPDGDTEDSILKHGIGQDKLQALIVNKIRAKRGLILLDTCESGASVTGSNTRNDTEAALGKLNEATGRTVITASNASQSALEGYEGHGVFTFAILEALVKGDTNGNGTIEVSEIEDWVQKRAPELSARLEGKSGGKRGLTLGYASSGYAKRAAITTSADQIAAEDEGSAQKPRTGSRAEDFSLVSTLAQWPPTP